MINFMDTKMDVTFPYLHLKDILNNKYIDKETINQHIKINDPEIILFKEQTPPKIKITLFCLEPLHPSSESSDILSFPVNADSRIDMVIGSKSGKPQQFILRSIKSCFLWDLSKFNKVDIVRSGRFKQNDFHPVICEEPIEMDLGVSREHSLICYFDQKVFYVDYGTSTKHLANQKALPDKSSHFGSKNGSWVYREYSIVDCIKNRSYEWNIHSTIGIGTFFYNVMLNDINLKLFHQFSFNYEYLKK